MNKETGELKTMKEMVELPAEEKVKYVQVNRDLTLKEKLDMQIRLYAPCGCGSGKKFKFCCKEKKA